jgi:hypothetical protein
MWIRSSSVIIKRIVVWGIMSHDLERQTDRQTERERRISRRRGCRLLLLVSYLTCSSTLKVEAVCSYETSTSLRTIRIYNSEDRSLEGTESYLRSKQSVSFSRNSAYFVELKGSLHFTQEAFNGVWSESDEFSPHPWIPFLEYPF